MKQNLIEAVQRYAVANYNRNGWDYAVECWGPAEIAEIIGKARTEAGAIRKAGRVCRLLDERRREVRSEIW